MDRIEYVKEHQWNSVVTDVRVGDVGITYPRAGRYQPFSIYFKSLFVAEKRRVPRLPAREIPIQLRPSTSLPPSTSIGSRNQ